MKAVLDCGVVFSGAGWHTESYWVLVALARRRFQAFATAATMEELLEVCARRRDQWNDPNEAMHIVNWYASRVRMVQAAALGKQRSRDAKDDRYLAAAVGASAGFVVSRDPHLLDLGKPFGVEIVTPRQFLSRLAGL